MRGGSTGLASTSAKDKIRQRAEFFYAGWIRKGMERMVQAGCMCDCRDGFGLVHSEGLSVYPGRGVLGGMLGGIIKSWLWHVRSRLKFHFLHSILLHFIFSFDFLRYCCVCLPPWELSYP
jgi:hypothetical protein